MNVVLHADMDAFYAAVEQRDEPSLRGRPVIVGGVSSRGVVSAASYEARVYGVHSAMPTVRARKLCPDGVFLPGDMAKYRRESRRIFSIFRRFTPCVEGISLDEAFLDLTGAEALLGPSEGVGARLRRELRAETGLAVSVGIGPVKLVAKIASDLAKPDGMRVVPSSQVVEFLDPLPVGRIWGIGPVARAKLAACGISTIGELARQSEVRLQALLGSFGPRAAKLARGEDAREVESDRDAKSYGEENTFAEDVLDPERLGRAIRAHSEAVAARLRRDGLAARGIQLKLKLARRLGGGRFPLVSRALTLPASTDDGSRIARAAGRLLRRSGVTEPVRLLGVAVTRLESAGGAQLDLLGSDADLPRSRRLNRAVDAIRERFGRAALLRGGGLELRAGLSLQIKRGELE